MYEIEPPASRTLWPNQRALHGWMVTAGWSTAAAAAAPNIRCVSNELCCTSSPWLPFSTPWPLVRRHCVN